MASRSAAAYPSAALALLAGLLGAFATGCSAPAGHRDTIQGASATASGSSPAAVIAAWTSAEQTLYGYLQAPPGPDRAALAAGESTTLIWPKLGEHWTGNALSAEETFLTEIKTNMLNGPEHYDLGHPVVSKFSTTAATVAACIDDSGTTTAGGAPGPTNLDGGPGGFRGTWELRATDGWAIQSFTTESVSQC